MNKLHDFLLGDKTTGIATEINRKSKIDSALALNIYERNRIYGFLSSLEKSFPLTKAILTEGNFQFFSREYIYSEPCQIENLDLYGESFPKFLKAREELGELPWLGDFARLEWLWEGIYRTHHHELLIDSLQFERFEYPVFEVWQAMRTEDEEIEIESPEQEAQFICLWQDETNDYAEPVHPQVFLSLKKLSKESDKTVVGSDMVAFIREKGWLRAR